MPHNPFRATTPLSSADTSHRLADSALLSSLRSTTMKHLHDLHPNSTFIPSQGYPVNTTLVGMASRERLVMCLCSQVHGAGTSQGTCHCIEWHPHFRGQSWLGTSLYTNSSDLRLSGKQRVSIRLISIKQSCSCAAIRLSSDCKRSVR